MNWPSGDDPLTNETNKQTDKQTNKGDRAAIESHRIKAIHSLLDDVSRDPLPAVNAISAASIDPQSAFPNLQAGDKRTRINSVGGGEGGRGWEVEMPFIDRFGHRPIDLLMRPIQCRRVCVYQRQCHHLDGSGMGDPDPGSKLSGSPTAPEREDGVCVETDSLRTSPRPVSAAAVVSDPAPPPAPPPAPLPAPPPAPPPAPLAPPPFSFSDPGDFT